MPNTREKLIELLDDIQLRGEDFTDYEIYGMRLPNTVSNDDVADHLIANGVTVQEWISVKDRLPQDDLPFGALCEIVQVLLDDGTVTVGWCNRGLKCWYYMPIQATNFVGHDYDKTPVIAWQSLSQPPKEGER